MMSDTQELFEGTLAEDSMKAAQEAGLTAEGRYRATVKAFNGGRDGKEFFDSEETQPNPYFGKIRWNIQLSLGSIRGGEGVDPKTTKTAPYVMLDNPKTFFLKLCTAVVHSDGGRMTSESKLYGDIANTVGKDIGRTPSDKDIHDWLNDNALEVYIAQYEAGEKNGRSWNAGNRVNSVTKAVE